MVACRPRSRRPARRCRAGRALREFHDHLAHDDGAGLPHFARLAEVRAIAATLDLPAAEAADLAEAVALAEVAVAGIEVRLQPVHTGSRPTSCCRWLPGPTSWPRTSRRTSTWL